jgi:hypothetical protein
VGEGHDELAAPGLGVEELEAHQLVEVRIELVLPHRPEERDRRLLPQHRGGLEEPARRLGEAVDPGEQDLLDRIGDRRARMGIGGRVDHPRELLQEEGIAFRLREDDVGDPVGHPVAAADGAQDAQAVLP